MFAATDRAPGQFEVSRFHFFFFVEGGDFFGFFFFYRFLSQAGKAGASGALSHVLFSLSCFP